MAAPERGAEPAAASQRIQVEQLTPRVEGNVRARATVEIAAPATVVRDQVLNLDARVEESWIVESVFVYRDVVRAARIHRRAKWVLSVLGIEIVYHTMYDWDAESNAVRWSLDASEANDLPAAEGVYALGSGAAAGTTRLEYTVEVGTRHAATRALKKRITVRSVRQLLEAIRHRSEETAK